MPEVKNPGTLNKRFIFEKAVSKKDGAGGPYDDYEKDFACWGGLIPNRGQELFQAGKFSSQVDGIVEIRYRDDFTAKHRIKIAGTKRILEILSYYDPEQNRARIFIPYRETKK